MSDYRIYLIDKNFPAFDQLEKLYKQFYAGMNEQGLLLQISEKGEKLWMDSVRFRLGKLAAVYVAESSNHIVGFSSGYIKLLPNFLGGYKTGFIDGIYLLPEFRKSGIAQELYEVLENWLCEQNVQSIELQVLTGNSGGIRFWEKMGYRTELHQMRKLLQ
jgi:ribosomal protein S18 acetylase RimI-like enzyme